MLSHGSDDSRPQLLRPAQWRALRGGLHCRQQTLDQEHEHRLVLSKERRTGAEARTNPSCRMTDSAKSTPTMDGAQQGAPQCYETRSTYLRTRITACRWRLGFVGEFAGPGCFLGPSWSIPSMSRNIQAQAYIEREVKLQDLKHKGTQCQ